MKNKLLKWLLPILSVLLAFLIGGVIIALLGRSPLEAYGYLFQGALGNQRAFSETLVKMVPLAFTGLCATFAYRCGVFNLGGEGQFIMGAIAGCWFATTFTGLNGTVSLLLSLGMGTMAGCIWGSIPGFLKAYKNLNEMITSIFLNYVAAFFMAYLYTGPLREGTITQTAAVPEAARLVKIMESSRLHAGLIMVLVLAAVLQYFLFHTAKGMQLRAVGLNSVASKVNGIPVKKMMLMSFLVSGAIAGLGGATEIFGVSFRLQPGFGAGFGFDGVAVALIGQLNPIGTLLAAFAFAVLKNGAMTMQIGSTIPSSISSIIQGLVILFVIIATAVANSSEMKSIFARVGLRRGKKTCREDSI